MKTMKKTVALMTMLAIFFMLTACTSHGSVRVISNGSEHTALEHWNHGFSPRMNASGWAKTAEDIADELSPFPLEDDFQIIVEGPIWENSVYYYFYQLVDGEWELALVVYIQDDLKRVYLTHESAWEREKWEEVEAESLFDLLTPGEYVLDVGVWWGNSRTANSYQNFFRMIKQP